MKKSLLGFGLALLWAATALQAQQPLEQAKTYFNVGAQAYEAGQFVAAAEAFEQSYKLSSRPAILFSMAQAWKRQYYIDKKPESVHRAVALYRDYLSKVEQGGRRADAAQALVELEPIAAKLAPEGTSTPVDRKPLTRIMISSPTPGANVTLDSAAPVPVPLIAEVQPGPHKVKVTADGYFDELRDVPAAEGAVVAFDMPLRDKPAHLGLEGDPGAEVSVDGRVVGTTPLLTPLDITPGRHLIVVAKNGKKPFVREIEFERNESRSLPFTLSSTAQRKTAYGMLTGAGLGLIAGAVFTGLALRQQDRAQQVLDAQGQGNILAGDADRYDRARGLRDDWRTAAAIAFGGGLALGTTGVLLYVFDTPTATAQQGSYERKPTAPTIAPPRGPSSLEVSFVPSLLPGATGASLCGTF